MCKSINNLKLKTPSETNRFKLQHAECAKMNGIFVLLALNKIKPNFNVNQ